MRRMLCCAPGQGRAGHACLQMTFQHTLRPETAVPVWTWHCYRLHGKLNFAAVWAAHARALTVT